MIWYDLCRDGRVRIFGVGGMKGRVCLRISSVGLMSFCF